MFIQYNHKQNLESSVEYESAIQDMHFCMAGLPRWTLLLPNITEKEHSNDQQVCILHGTK